MPSHPHPSSHLVRTTPFPNALLDEVMPTLRDTEWRLLCLIVRQTLGWQEKGGGRKARDWLTHRQLQRRTGRASEAVCKALDALVRRGLVEVQDEVGQPLLTPGARRHYGGKLFFRLGVGAAGKGTSILHTTSQKRKGAEKEKSVFSKANLTKSEKPFSESEIRKAKTTKETETKISPSVLENLKALSPQKVTHHNVASLDLSSEMMQLIRLYERKYRDHVQKDNLHREWTLDAAKMQEALQKHSLPQLDGLLDVFFTQRSHWFVRQQHSLHAFLNAINVLLILQSRTVSPQRLVAKKDEN